MTTRKVFGILLGLGSLALIGNLIYRFSMGMVVSFIEVLFLCLFLLLFFFTITWGSRKKKDGILPSEELGKQIENQSIVISYYWIVGFLFIGLVVDRIVTGNVNMTLMILLGVALITPAIMTYIIAQTYQITPNLIGKFANRVMETNATISKKNETKSAIY